MKSKLLKIDNILIMLFIIIGLLTRTVLHLGPNVEFVTGLSLASGYFLRGQKKSFLVPILIMSISDLIIGNSVIFIFTWSAFLLTPLIGKILTVSKPKLFYNIIAGMSGSLISNIIFFLWTNFGVVLTTNMYERNINGLIQSYINAIPFFKNQLISNIIIAPLLFLTTSMAINIAEHISSKRKIEIKLG